MWDLPRPRIKPVSPALAGKFLSTVPPEKSQDRLFSITPSIPGLTGQGWDTAVREVRPRIYGVFSLFRGKWALLARTKGVKNGGWVHLSPWEVDGKEGEAQPHFFLGNGSISSVAQSCPTLQPHELQHARPPCASPVPRVYPNSCPSSRWCYSAISSSVIPFSSCPQFLQESGSFPMSQLFARGGQNIGVSASISVLPMNTQDWSPLGWIGWISLQSKGLSRVFSNTAVQKHQFFSAQLSSQSNSHIHTWPLEKP